MKVKAKKSRPFEFVFEGLGSLPITTRPMFGCLAIYVGERIVMMLRDKKTELEDNGVWIAMTPEHQASLRQEFPNMRAIGLLGGKITGWQNLPASAPDFEGAAMR